VGILREFSFTGIECNQTDNSNTQDPDPAVSWISRANDNTTSNGRGWQVTSAANYSGGAGGNGFRHWRGDGTNNLSGGITITLPSSYTELWLRWYMRYQSGFAWTPAGNPLYTKDIYGSEGGDYWIYGIQGAGWGLTDISSANHSNGAMDWSDLMGGNTGDGLWHCHEFHINRAGAGAGVIEVWIDDVQYVNATGLTLSNTSMSSFRIGSNQDEVTGAGAADYYTDYDDFAVSDTARIGPLGGGGESPGFVLPQSVLISQSCL
jgi:hypothetical protein